MDLGCGKMYLRNFLKNNYYIPVDYTKRDDDTIICDFNKKEFPDINADICFISGCLEYIEEYSWFINKVCNNSNRVILSYCTTDEFPDLVLRKSYSWVNHLSEQTIRLLFDKNSFGLIKTDKSHNKDQIFIFEKS